MVKVTSPCNHGNRLTSLWGWCQSVVSEEVHVRVGRLRGWEHITQHCYCTCTVLWYNADNNDGLLTLTNAAKQISNHAQLIRWVEEKNQVENKSRRKWRLNKDLLLHQSRWDNPRHSEMLLWYLKHTVSVKLSDSHSVLQRDRAGLQK